MAAVLGSSRLYFFNGVEKLMSVPNQKIIKIAERTERNRDNLYTTTNLEALQIAMLNLKESGLKLWLYLNKNQEGYNLELSPKACESWGIKKTSYYRAVEELIEKGFLVPLRENSNIYFFYELPQD